MYQVGIVGCGVIGSRLADAFADHDRTTVWGACDVDRKRAESFAAEYDCEAFTDHRTMVERDAVDVVYVGVPPVHHVEVAGDALRADNHVLCEKPLAPHADAGRELVELETETDRATAINLPFRYTPGFVDLRERVAGGEVGEPKRVDLHFRFPRWPREWQDVDWLKDHDQGGPLREVGTHFLFGVQEAFGGIDRVSAEVTFTAPGKYEESIVGYFVTDGDGRGKADGDGQADAGSSGSEGDGVHGTIDLACDHRAAEVNSITVLGSEGALTLVEWYKLIADRGEEGERVVNDTRERTTLTLIDEFVAELDGDGGDLVSFAEANRVQRVVDAIFESDGEMQYPES
jgi:predicted dehydrogenase